jgi:hypothetical protein
LNGKSPHEALYGKKVSGKMLRIWGSTCYAHVQKTKRSNPKFSNRAIECKLLGLSTNYEGYRLLDVKGKQYLTARDVKFGDTTTASLITRSFPPEVLNLSEEELNEVYALGKRKRGTETQSGGSETRHQKTSRKLIESTSTVVVGLELHDNAITTLSLHDRWGWAMASITCATASSSSPRFNRSSEKRSR